MDLKDINSKNFWEGKIEKVTTGLLVFSQMFQHYRKDVYTIYDQIYDSIENRFSKYQCGFRKGLKTQNALFSMVEKMLLTCNKKENCGAMLTDLSKAFD